ncbi:protein of unknown function (plasmid) [Caballeronia sp. S22]
MSAATLNALRAHWPDRAKFDGATEEDKQSVPLLSFRRDSVDRRVTPATCRGAGRGG